MSISPLKLVTRIIKYSAVASVCSASFYSVAAQTTQQASLHNIADLQRSLQV